MQGIQRAKKFDLAAICMASAVALFSVILVPAEYIVWVWVALGGVTVFLVWCRFGDLLTLVLVWFVVVACMSYFLWRHPIEIFGHTRINVTIDRLFAMVVLAAAIVSLVLRTATWRPLPGAAKAGILMAVCFTVSMMFAGTKSIADVSPYFRLIGGYYIPLIMLVVVFFAIREDTQLKKICWFFFIFGVYLTFTAWAEHLKLWHLVFPRYIANPELGIHWGRARGPFLVAPTLGTTLIFCFFSNLHLSGRVAGPVRIMIYIVNVLILPAIFFTQTRSVWLTMVICTVIWTVWARNVRSRVSVLGTLCAAAVVLTGIFWSDITSVRRMRGGVADPYPIYARIGLAKVSLSLFFERPVFGVGFGHFRDYASKLPADPSSPYARFGAQQMEHNNFLSILTETGVCGLGLYLTMLWMLFKTSLRMYRRLSPTGSGWITRQFVVLYWIMLVNYVVDGMFRETSVDPFNNGLFLTISGVVLAMNYLLASRDRLTAASLPAAARA